jgi:hypothetical protein
MLDITTFNKQDRIYIILPGFPEISYYKLNLLTVEGQTSGAWLDRTLNTTPGSLH